MTPEPRICHNPACGYETLDQLSTCPKCKRWMMPNSSFRNLGVVLAALGAILLLGGSALVWLVLSNISRFKGGTALQLFVVGVTSLVPAMGLAIVSMGLWQYIFGRANTRLVFAFVVLVQIFLLIAAAVKILN